MSSPPSNNPVSGVLSPANSEPQGPEIITAEKWTNKRKWIILTVVAFCQISMNFNAAVYSNAIEGINHDFGITNARLGMTAFLVPYAIGCELWAPWSEELGRWPIMQVSLFLTNISVTICGVSNNFGQIVGGRVMGGLSSAGGSVTMGMVADMFPPENQQFAVLWASLFSCLGAVIGGICGGPIQQFMHWRGNFFIQLALGCSTQLLHLVVAKETRSTIIVEREMKRLRAMPGGESLPAPTTRTLRERINVKEFAKIMFRPYQMLMFEPIVLFLSLLSGFADALIFSFFESYGYVFSQWGFSPTQISMALIPLAVSYILAYLSFFPIVKRHNNRRSKGHKLAPESRLWWLLFQVVLLPIGLLGSAFVSSGPPLHWSGIVVFSVLIGMANFSIYYASVDYMVAAYGEYSASATGGNGFARDFLAGMCALYTGPMYHKLGIQNSQLVLFALGFAFCIPVYIFYWKGSEIRRRSKFAMELANEKDNRAERRSRTDSVIPERTEDVPGSTSIPLSEMK